jgi:hypothetical protein
MVHIHMPSRGNASGPDQRPGIGQGRTIPATVPREVQISPSWRHFVQHFLEMFAAMWVGMIVGVPVFLVIAGQSSPREAALRYPVAAVLGMALSMTVPMVGWMLYRGHGWRNATEMAAAMLVPAIPFVLLSGLHVVKGTTCCAYMGLSTLAMLGLMFYHRDVYSMPMRPLRREHLRPQHR